MNKKRFLIGLLILVFDIAAISFFLGYGDKPMNIFLVILFVIFGIALVFGLSLSLSELVKSIVKRLKAAREREKATRDMRRQARRSKENSTSE